MSLPLRATRVREALPPPRASGAGEGPWCPSTPTGPAPPRAALLHRRGAWRTLPSTAAATHPPIHDPPHPPPQRHPPRHSARTRHLPLPRTRSPSRLRVTRPTVATRRHSPRPAASAPHADLRGAPPACAAATSARTAPGGTTTQRRPVRAALLPEGPPPPRRFADVLLSPSRQGCTPSKTSSLSRARSSRGTGRWLPAPKRATFATDCRQNCSGRRRRCTASIPGTGLSSGRGR